MGKVRSTPFRKLATQIKVFDYSWSASPEHRSFPDRPKYITTSSPSSLKPSLLHLNFSLVSHNNLLRLIYQPHFIMPSSLEQLKATGTVCHSPSFYPALQYQPSKMLSASPGSNPSPPYWGFSFNKEKKRLTHANIYWFWFEYRLWSAILVSIFLSSNKSSIESLYR